MMNILQLLLVDPNLEGDISLFRDDATGAIFLQSAGQHWYGRNLEEVCTKAEHWYRETQT